MTLSVRLAESMGDVCGAWPAHAPRGETFLSSDFLALLEETGCATPEKGWAPAHLVFEDSERPLAVVPAYAKAHSEGEFVFDWAWADAHERFGVPYYPKLLVAVPFTPATGSRVLAAPGVDRTHAVARVAEALPELADRLGVSSVHVNFLEEDAAAAFVRAGFVERHGLQLHWHREGASSTEEFLARFDSKRRNQWKRELRRVHDAGVTWRRLEPHELTAEKMAFVHRCYRSTVDAHVYGRPYLNEAFFQAIAASSLRDSLVVLQAERGGEPIAMTFNVLAVVNGVRTLFGRYWGALVHVPLLHFVLGYAALIETAIELAVDVIEPGAGGEHKQARGFDPVVTRSVHWVREPRLRRAIAEHVARERAAIEGQRLALLADSPFRARAHT